MRDEALGRHQRAGRLLRRNLGAGSGLIVGNGFEIVGVGQKGSQLGREIHVVLCQALKFRMYALVRFDRSAGPL